MLHITDVIGGQIGKNAHLKGNPVHTAVGQRLGGNLQHGVLHTRTNHLIKIHMEFLALGGGIHRFQMSVTDDHAVGADVGALLAHTVQNSRHHQRRGGLSLGAGDADNMKPIGGTSVELRADHGQSLSGVLHADHHRIRRQIHLVAHKKGTASLLIGGLSIIVPVRTCPDQADEETACLCPPGIVFNPLYIYLRCRKRSQNGHAGK